MALLETSQEQSKREMDEMDELADLRQVVCSSPVRKTTDA